MKLLTSAIAFAGLLAFNKIATADVLLLEDFVDAAIDCTTSVAEFTDNDRDFFIRTDGSDHGGGVVVYSGIAGSSCFTSMGDLNATAI